MHDTLIPCKARRWRKHVPEMFAPPYMKSILPIKLEVI